MCDYYFKHFPTKSRQPCSVVIPSEVSPKFDKDRLKCHLNFPRPISSSDIPVSSFIMRPRDFGDILDLHKSRFQEDYEPIRVLGKGAFGMVWCVKNRLDGVEYAVKRVKLRHEERDGDLEKVCYFNFISLSSKNCLLI